MLTFYSFIILTLLSINVIAIPNIENPEELVIDNKQQQQNESTVDDPILKYLLAVQQISSAVKTNSSTMYHNAYHRLAYLVDTYGPRLWGSQQLELAIDDLTQQAQVAGFDRVTQDPVVNFTKWVRGKEYLTLYSPRQYPQKLSVIGLGYSISGNVTAEVIVVNNFSQLDSISSKVKGKIVLYNVPWANYSYNVNYRENGASAASKYGAVASLIRSVTPYSIYSVHTGVQDYSNNTTPIPAAAITVEDAEMFQRMQDRGQKIVVNLYLENQMVPGQNSSNLLGDFLGSQYPEQIILAGGHIDSWDTGSQTGANDDGGGFITVFEAVRVLINLGLRPKRTIRFIAWSGEEFGASNNGANQYVQQHMAEMPNHIVAFESDLGNTKPYGFGFTGGSNATAIITNIAQTYLTQINCNIISQGGTEADTGPLANQGVPTLKNDILDTPNHDFYFTYHHSAGDAMTMMNADELDDNVVAIASMLYIIADWDVTIPRN